MNPNEPAMEQHHENEEVTAAGEAFSPEISPEIESAATETAQGTEKLHAELSETRDKFLRIYSEFDNYKKRVQRERLDLLKSASSEVIISLLPVLDDFERALKAMDAAGKDKAQKEGVELIYNKFKGILEQKGLKKMVSVGEKFDTDLHDAITNIPVPDVKQKGKVIDEVESGYYLNDKIIRHAKVIVGE